MHGSRAQNLKNLNVRQLYFQRGCCAWKSEKPKCTAVYFWTEAATRGVLYKMLFLKFRNIHRKTPVLDSLFNKLQAWRTDLFLLKRGSNTDFFLWILRNLLEHLLWRTSENGCFCSEWLLKYSLVQLKPNKGINVEPCPYDFCHYF